MVPIMSKRHPPEVHEKAGGAPALKRLDEYGTHMLQAAVPLVDAPFETPRIWIKKPLAEGAGRASKQLQVCRRPRASCRNFGKRSETSSRPTRF